jgi:putative oxidoreductase
MNTLLEKFQSPVLMLVRLLLAQIFVIEGWGKISAYGDVQQYMTTHGVSGALLPLVILTELGGGLCIALGFLTRLAALALAGFCVLTALFFHTGFSDVEQLINFQKNLAMAGGFLALVVFGAGALSVDAAFWPDRQKRPL